MSRGLLIRKRAEADISAAVARYNKQEAGLGLELLEELRAAIFRTREAPGLSTRVRRHPEVRKILANRFPYRIFYIVRSDSIVVFCVLHASRHDRHWRDRL